VQGFSFKVIEMIKRERKCNVITQLSDTNQIRVSSYKDGRVKKEKQGTAFSFFADNSQENRLFDQKEFYNKCSYLDWANDISPIIEQSKFDRASILSLTVMINQERCFQEFEVDSKQFINDISRTLIELRLTIKTNNSLLNIKRNVCNKGLLDKDAIKNLVKCEIDKIEHQYYPFIGLDLICINPEEYEIILPAGIGGIYVHEALGHCLEGDLYFKKDSVLHGRLGQRITSNSCISISDSCDSNDLIYYNMSDDGSIPKTVNLIDEGYLVNVMTDEYTANFYGIDNTGNGRTFDCFSFPIPRMRNTYIHNGNQSPKDIIESTHKGIIATDILGGNVIVQNGNFVFNVAHALVIENGEIIGITAPFLFTGNIIQSLDRVDAIGNDLSFVHAVCGKSGQLISVSYGQPTIRIAKQGR